MNKNHIFSQLVSFALLSASGSYALADNWMCVIKQGYVGENNGKPYMEADYGMPGGTGHSRALVKCQDECRAQGYNPRLSSAAGCKSFKGDLSEFLQKRCNDASETGTGTARPWWPRHEKPDWWKAGAPWSLADCLRWKAEHRGEEDDIEQIYSWCTDVVTDWAWWKNPPESAHKYPDFERWDKSWRHLNNCVNFAASSDEKAALNSEKAARYYWNHFLDWLRRRQFDRLLIDTLKANL